VAGSRADADAWNALAWVVLLFSAFNAVSKPWPEDSPEMRSYLIHVLKPQEWILARITFFQSAAERTHLHRFCRIHTVPWF
jgi:heme exporter protein B